MAKVFPRLAAGASALALVALLAPLRAALAQAPAPGPLFTLSTCESCIQRNPTVAGGAGLNFLTVWDGVSDVVHDIVFGRIFSAPEQPLAADFSVQPALEMPPPQFDSAAASDGVGNFVVVWSTFSDDQSSIMAQRYTRRGRALGAPILVAAGSAALPSQPSNFAPVVATVPGGGFVVAWINQDPQNSGTTPPRVMVRRYNAAAAAAGAAIQVSTGLATGERPAVCVSSTGRVHVAWTYAADLVPFEPSDVGVALRRLTPAGVLVGPEQVISEAADAETSVAVSCGPVNDFTVAWETGQAPAAAGTDIVAQRFDKFAQPAGGAFVVNQVTQGDQRNPALLGDGNGNFVAVWEGAPNGINGARGRRFSANGEAASNEFVIYRGGQGDITPLRPAIATVGTAGEFVVVVNTTAGVAGRTFTQPAARSAAALEAPAADEEGGVTEP